VPTSTRSQTTSAANRQAFNGAADHFLQSAARLLSSVECRLELRPPENLGYIPVGFGAGKVIQIGKVPTNFFVEPQYTVYHYGEQVPHWQIYAGPNFQF
jgi:hypothetical protein